MRGQSTLGSYPIASPSPSRFRPGPGVEGESYAGARPKVKAGKVATERILQSL